jgi:VanZ family protein
MNERAAHLFRLLQLGDKMLQSGRYILLRLLCLAMWCGLMVAGLWPFRFFPDNRVQWLVNRNGIHFYEPSQIYSAAPETGSERRASAATNGSFSIEIWLQPERVSDRRRTIFSVYDAERESLSIGQSVADLLMRGRFLGTEEAGHTRSIYLDNCFREGERFITITSGPQGTAIYLEGVKAKFVPYQLEPDSLSGRWLLGDSASSNKTWAGTVFGLAIYDQALSDVEVLEHYRAWTTNFNELVALGSITALYPLDEKAGDVVHNRAGKLPDMVIPKKFQPLHRAFLEPSFKFVKSDLLDAIVNIVGFVPFGLLVSAYLHRGLPFPRYQAILLTILVGGLTSLLIECLQAYLPTRTSSLPDVINNILGTAMGAMLLGSVRRRLMALSPASGL